MKIQIHNKKDLICAEIIMACFPVALVGFAGWAPRQGMVVAVAVTIGYCIGKFHEEQIRRMKDGNRG